MLVILKGFAVGIMSLPVSLVRTIRKPLTPKKSTLLLLIGIAAILMSLQFLPVSALYGIDVGGNFTDAVAIGNATYEIIAQEKIPTTHDSKNGVAEGESSMS